MGQEVVEGDWKRPAMGTQLRRQPEVHPEKSSRGRESWMKLCGLRLVILHYHFRPGGVRRVIETATPHLVAHWPSRVDSVLLATGEAPDPAWLGAFRARMRGTPIDVRVESGFGYASELGQDGKAIQGRVREGMGRLLREVAPDALIWAHNLGLGRNLILARELAFACHVRDIPLMAQHHDWWFENRWHHFAAVRQPGFRALSAVARAVLAGSPHICHVAINQADAAVLKRYFHGLAGWLPNPVERGAAPSVERVEGVRSWLHGQLGEKAPVWLLPCRLLRRKNIAEALLLTRWLRPEAWLVTTGGVSSAEEQAYADRLTAAAVSHGWRLRAGVLRGEEHAKPCVPELLAASEVAVLTSLQEGFGLPYLEAAAAGRPLIARSLPNIAPDLAKFGFTFPQSYREVFVDPGLFDWRGERERQAGLFREWRRGMPRAVGRQVGKPVVLAAAARGCAVPFSRLTLTAQLEVLSQPVERSWARCAPLNPFLPVWRERAVAQRLETSPWPRDGERWLGGRAYARRFLELVPPSGWKAPRPGAGVDAQGALLRLKLRAEHLYPILWDFCA